VAHLAVAIVTVSGAGRGVRDTHLVTAEYQLRRWTCSRRPLSPRRTPPLPPDSAASRASRVSRRGDA